MGSRGAEVADGTLAVLCCTALRLLLLQGSAVAVAAGRRRLHVPRLTAANFRFFLRGRSSKAGAGDVVVSARRRANLAPYDRALRAFRYG